jgi:uncharacterized membrane protein YkoI
MQITSSLWRRLLLLGIILLGSGNAFAGNDHERARQLREAGEILPLETILSQVRARGNTGHVLEVELKNRHGRYVYEIEMLDAQGRVQESILDARTGKPLGAKVDD